MRKKLFVLIGSLFVLTVLLIVLMSRPNFNKDKIIKAFTNSSLVPNFYEILPESVKSDEFAFKKLSITMDSGLFLTPVYSPNFLNDCYSFQNTFEALRIQVLDYLNYMNLDGTWEKVASQSVEGRLRYHVEGADQILRSEITKLRYDGTEVSEVFTKSELRLFPDGEIEYRSDGEYDGVMYLRSMNGKSIELVIQTEDVTRYGAFSAVNGIFRGEYVYFTPDGISIESSTGNSEYYEERTIQVHPEFINYHYNIFNDSTLIHLHTASNIGGEIDIIEIPIKKVMGINAVRFTQVPLEQISVAPIVEEIIQPSRTISGLEMGLELVLDNIYTHDKLTEEIVFEGISGKLRYTHSGTTSSNELKNLFHEAVIANQLDLTTDLSISDYVNKLKNSKNYFGEQQILGLSPISDRNDFTDKVLSKGLPSS